MTSQHKRAKRPRNGAEPAQLPEVDVYTDGGCDPNPGPGGWAAILLYGSRCKELCGNEAHTTNNRMELTAAIEALRHLRHKARVTIHTDSQYLRRGIQEWLPSWKARGWVRAGNRPLKNADLWRELDRQTQRHRVRWRWLRGHTGHPLNERADRLARKARYRLVGKRLGEASVSEKGSVRGRVMIFTGACSLGRQGPGGYAAVIVHNGREQIISGAWPVASSNAMHLQSVIAALCTLDRVSSVCIVTPSKYVIDGATHWLAQWERNGWRTRSGRRVEHMQLWRKLADVMGDHDILWRHAVRSEHRRHVQRAAQVARREAERLSRGKKRQ